MVEPDDVATAIVEAVEHRRFEVYVPRSVGPLLKVMSVLPRSARELISHALKGDRVLAKPDAALRAVYEARAAEGPGGRSVPPGPEVAEQIPAG
jgi:hypothetical protein